VEQDYSYVIEHFDQLRIDGVTELREHIGGNWDTLRDIVALIKNVAANPAAIEVIGMTPEEVAGFINPVIVNDESVLGWLDQLENVWHGRTYSEFDFLGSTPGGDCFDIHRRMAVPDGPVGPDYRRVVVTIENTTEKRNEQRRLEQLVSEKNEFLASVSHEIRTPLTGVLGFTELLIAEGESMSAEERAEMLEAIAHQSREVSNIVEDLLISTRTESGDLSVTHERVDLAEQVRMVIRAGGPHTRGVSVGAPDTPIVATGDPGRVRQVVRNLLTNTERYGGPDVRIAFGADDETTWVSVTDDGDGLSDDRMLEMFSSAKTSETATVSGATGLGLSICRRLATLMGGNLSYSRHEELSTFTLSLPR
jgi:signal transduction histidine kinase